MANSIRVEPLERVLVELLKRALVESAQEAERIRPLGLVRTLEEPVRFVQAAVFEKRGFVEGEVVADEIA